MLLNNIPDYAIVITDAAGSIISWSGSAKTIYGYSENEIVGKPISTLYPPKAIENNEPSENLSLALTNKTYLTTGFRIKNDGSIFFAAINYKALFNSKHELLGYMEQTEEQVAKKEGIHYKNHLQKNQHAIIGDNRFKKIIENSQEGITLLNADFNIIYRSPSAERISGWNSADRAKSTIKDLTHPGDVKAVEATLKQASNNPGQPITCIFRSKHFDGHFIWLECTYTNFLDDPEIKAIVCNFKDISEKKRDDDLLEDTLKELFDYKHALDESAIVAITDQKGIIQHVNQNFCRISKYSREELIGKDHRLINSGYHDKAFIKNLWTTIARGEVWKGDLKNKAKDGSYYWVDTTIVPFLNEKGKPYQYVAIRSDITERKLNEERIIENAGFIKTVTDNIPALIAYWTADLHCLFANKPHLEWFGKQLHEMQGISKQELLGDDEFKLHEVHIQHVLQGEAQSFERTFYNNKGKAIYTHTQYLPDKDHDKIKGFYSLTNDITDVKLAEAVIGKKNKQIEELLNNITDGFIALDDKLCYTYANKKICEMIGLSPESLIGKNIWAVFPDAIGTPTYNAIQTAVEEKRYVCNEDRYEPLNLWQENRIYPSDEGVSIFIRDITQRKHDESQKALLANISSIFSEHVELNDSIHQVLELLMDFGKFSMAEAWLISSDKKKISLTVKSQKSGLMETFYKESATVRSFVKGEGFPGIIWKTQAIQFWRDVVENKNFFRREAARKAGLKTIYGIPLQHYNKTIGVIMLGLNEDVEQKHELTTLFDTCGMHIGAEIKRKQLEQELNQVFNLAPDIICIVGVDGYFKKINPAMCTILEYTELELLSRPFREFVYTDDIKGTATQLDLIGEGNATLYFENRYVTRTGKIKWLAWTTTPVSEEGLTFCVAKDITDKKELEKLLEKATTLARIGGWEIDMVKGAVYWSAITKEIHEVESGFEPDLESASSFFKDGEDRAIIRQKVKDAFEKGKPYDVELQIVTAKGITKWIRVMGEAEFSVGKCVRIYGSFQDIDSRKKAEAGVREALEEKNTILESIDDAFFALDNNWVVTYWNKKAETLMGKPKNEMLNHNLWEIFPQAVGTEQYNKYQEVMTTGRSAHFDLYSDPLKLWLAISIYPAVNGLTVYIKDVTGRKNAELAVKQALVEKDIILESIGDAFYAIDKNWTVTYWNNMAEKLMQMPRSKIVGRNLWDVYADAISMETYTLLHTAMESNQTVRFDDYYPTMSLWLEISAYPSSAGLSVYFKDVSERKLAEAAVKEILEERNTILESIGDAFFAVDKNWTVTYWNNMAEKVLGKTKTEMVNNNLWDIFSDSTASQSYKKYHEALETQQAMHFEDYYPPLFKWYEISAYPSGNGLSVYFKDVSERKMAEIQLKELNQNLKKQAKELSISNAELEQFAYVASHDLQEPLRMITSFLSQIDKKYSPIIDERGKQYINFAVDGAKRMRQIILDLLDFSKVGALEDDLEAINVSKLIKEITALYRKQIEDSHAIIEFDDLPSINFYRTPLRQVFQNLVSNGLKYCKPGTPPKLIISAEEKPDHWQFSVKDNGIGIDAEYFDKIFIIFQRLHTKSQYSGTGMGLAITKKIIENMGGRVWLESELAVGSTFYFTIIKNNKS